MTSMFGYARRVILVTFGYKCNVAGRLKDLESYCYGYQSVDEPIDNHEYLTAIYRSLCLRAIEFIYLLLDLGSFSYI